MRFVRPVIFAYLMAEKSTRLVKLTAAAALALSFLVPVARAEDGALGAGDDTPARIAAPTPARVPQPTYKITAGIDGDVFPAFANYASMQKPQQREWGVITVQVSNSTDNSLRNRIAVKVQGWSDQEIQIAEMGAGQVRTYKFAPTFLPRLYRNREITGATAEIEISDMAGRTLHSETVPVRLRAAEDIYWGSKFKYAPFIASWVTPHEVEVEKVLAIAKNFAPKRRLPGYEPWKSVAEQERSTGIQARAIYEALKQHGVSYVKSSVTFGGNQDITQRVRMPRESLGQTSANCIDGAVMFASLFENLGMDPQIVLVPGHAVVGVRVAKGSQRFLYIDTALVGRSTYEAAVAAADEALGKFAPGQQTRISIEQARDAGIFPMP